jgi:hypothetical protein
MVGNVTESEKISVVYVITLEMTLKSTMLRHNRRQGENMSNDSVCAPLISFVTASNYNFFAEYPNDLNTIETSNGENWKY